MMAWDGHDSRTNIPILRRCVTEDLKANWQMPKHSSYLHQTEQARKLVTIVSVILDFEHGAHIWPYAARVRYHHINSPRFSRPK